MGRETTVCEYDNCGGKKGVQEYESYYIGDFHCIKVALCKKCSDEFIEMGYNIHCITSSE